MIGKYAKAIVALAGGAVAWVVNNVEVTDAGIQIALSAESAAVAGAMVAALAGLVYAVPNKTDAG